MNIKQLIKQLGQYPEDLEVIIASDPEGNDFHSLYEVSDHGWLEEERMLCLTPEMLTDDLRKQGFTEDDVYEEAPRVVCLWP